MILVVAYIGKFFGRLVVVCLSEGVLTLQRQGGSGAARVAGFGWRESFTIGTLMSCKGEFGLEGAPLAEDLKLAISFPRSH